MIQLPAARPYQERAHSAAQDAVRRLRGARQSTGGCGVLLCAPTGAGKTLLAMRIALGAVARRRRALWLAPRTELVEQPARRLWEYGLRDGVRVISGGGVSGSPDAAITIASIQTLVARGYTPEADVVILDEARHYAAAEWSKIAGAYRTSVRVGLDATPVRADGTTLRDLFDELVTVATVRELIDGGYLVPCVVRAPARQQPHLAEDPIVAYQRHTPGTRAVLFAPNRAASKRWAAAACEQGIPAEHVDGTTNDDVRRSALRRLGTGELRMLCNVALFAEGVDVPELETVIVARGVSTEATWIQMLGRALRPAEGKARATCLDLHGHVHRWGLVDEERTFSLDGVAIRRVEALPSAVQCRACLCWGAGGRPCAGCGAELPPPLPPKVSQRELREIRQANAPRQGADWDLWVELVQTMQDRGYKPQWAPLQFKAKTGRYPIWSLKQVEVRA